MSARCVRIFLRRTAARFGRFERADDAGDGARGLLGILRWSDALRDADRDGVSARDHLGAENEAVLRQVIGKMKWGIGK